MALTKPETANFQELLRAAKAGDLALIESTDKKTGERRAILCAMEWDGKEYLITPFGHLCPGDPYEAYTDPSQY